MFRQLSHRGFRSIATGRPAAVKTVNSSSFERSRVQRHRFGDVHLPFSTLAGRREKVPIKFELITAADVPNMVAYLKENFFPDEPLSNCLKIGTDCKDFMDFSINSVYDNCSFKAINEKGEIVGTITNEVVKKPPPGTPKVSLANCTNHQKFKKMMTLVDHVNSRYNVFDVYPDIDQYMDSKVVSVRRDYRGLHIASELVQLTRAYMREHNLRIYYGLCSSFYSARACLETGFKREFALDYADYVMNGERPILPPLPHKAIQIFVYEMK